MSNSPAFLITYRSHHPVGTRSSLHTTEYGRDLLLNPFSKRSNFLQDVLDSGNNILDHIDSLDYPLFLRLLGDTKSKIYIRYLENKKSNFKTTTTFFQKYLLTPRYKGQLTLLLSHTLWLPVTILRSKSGNRRSLGGPCREFRYCFSVASCFPLSPQVA